MAKRVKVQVLADRLNQYEALLQRHGIDRSELPDAVNSEIPSRPSLGHAANSEETHTYTAPAPDIEPNQHNNTTPSQSDHMRLKLIEK
jgi:hypothetical protein